VIRATLASFAVLALAAPAFAVKYSVSILQPAGFTYSAGTGNTSTNQVGYGSTIGSQNHALLWSGSAASAVDLNPFGYASSDANAIAGTRQAGEGVLTGGSQPHALLWNGTAASAVDLNPLNYEASSASGISTFTQVGSGFSSTLTNSNTHALLWTGSAASAVDLNPTGFLSSRALGATSTNQIGQAKTAANQTHAILWANTAASAVDLQPAGYGNTFGTALSGNNQVGYGSPTSGGNIHALLWHGTAATVVDLNPSGFTTSFANAVNGNTEVGSGTFFTTVSNTHALLWTGSAATAVDLQQYVTDELGSNFTGSEANGIADNGAIVGRVTDASFISYAVIWKPETGVLGDYNNNGVVDMADYVRWRNGSPLFNEVATLGTNTSQDYTEWRNRFSNTSGSGASNLSATTVPEPTSLALLTCALLVSCKRRSTRSPL